MTGFFRRFVQLYADIARPLYNLLKKNANFLWDSKCQTAFDTLRNKLCDPPLLAYPSWDLQFNLRTDASFYAVGCILTQGEINNDQPIAYMSRTFNKHELRYCASEKELLSILCGLRYFRSYILLRKTLIICDCSALKWLLSVKKNSRLLRWSYEMAEYDYEILWTPARANAPADALSRIQIPRETLTNMGPVTHKENPFHEVTINVMTRSKTKDKQVLNEKDPILNISSTKIKESDILNFTSQIENSISVFILIDLFAFPFQMVQKWIKTKLLANVLTKIDDNKYAILLSHQKNQIKLWMDMNKILKNEKKYHLYVYMSQSNYDLYVKCKASMLTVFDNSEIDIEWISNKLIYIENEEDKETILKNFHDTQFGGHMGIQATINKIKEKYYWHGIGNDVRKYVNACIACKKNKVTRHVKMPLCLTETAHKPWTHVMSDVVGPFTLSKTGNKFLITFVDTFSKYAEAVATPDITASTVAKAFVENICCRHNIPERITTDLGSDYTAEIFRETCKLLEIAHNTATVTWHQSIGNCEKWHKEIGAYLRIFAEQKTDQWDTFIPYLLFVRNNTPSSVTSYSPHYLLYGYTIDVPVSLKSNPTPVYNYDNYVSVLQNRLRTAYEYAREKIVKSKETNKRIYDEHINPVEFRVGSKVLLWNDNKQNKLDTLYKGPFLVVDVENENCIINYNGKNKKFHKNKLKLVEY